MEQTMTILTLAFGKSGTTFIKIQAPMDRGEGT
jgi:hypothetical protein